MKTVSEHDMVARAQWSVLRDFSRGFFSAIRNSDPREWIDCDAKEVAIHVVESDYDASVHDVWISFPGGFPRFLDMLRSSEDQAIREGRTREAEWISVALSDSVLKKVV